MTSNGRHLLYDSSSSSNRCVAVAATRSAVADMAQEFCVENDLCSREKKNQKKKKNKTKKGKKNERKAKPKKSRKAPVEPTTVQADMAQKREIVEQARKRGVSPGQMREKVRNANFKPTAEPATAYEVVHYLMRGFALADAIR
eukprot:COSAG02_NODE_3026_length_7517_cov_4.200593_8_plen_143_part_00